MLSGGAFPYEDVVCDMLIMYPWLHATEHGGRSHEPVRFVSQRVGENYATAFCSMTAAAQESLVSAVGAATTLPQPCFACCGPCSCPSGCLWSSSSEHSASIRAGAAFDPSVHVSGFKPAVGYQVRAI